ncbi:MAG: tyrosine-type recombinase/integrase, partial [Planctomycetota bacterium]
RRHDRRALTDDELRKLIAAAEEGTDVCGLSGQDRAMLYRIAVGTGFRRNEIRSLTPKSFDLDGDPPTITVEAGYSKRRRRDVQPIRKDLADLLRVWLAWKKPGQPVLQTTHWLWHRTSDMMKADLAAAEIKYKDDSGRYADFHALRHTYITNIGRLPVSMKTHQELARHSEPGLTMRYTHAEVEQKVKALDALPPADPDDEGDADETVVV